MGEVDSGEWDFEGYSPALLPAFCDVNKQPHSPATTEGSALAAMPSLLKIPEIS